MSSAAHHCVHGALELVAAQRKRLGGQPDPDRLSGLDLVIQEVQFPGLGRPDYARKEPGAAKVTGEPSCQEAGPENRVSRTVFGSSIRLQAPIGTR